MQQSRREHIYCSFLEGINDYIKRNLHAQYVQVFLPPKLCDPRPFTWSGYTVKPEYNYVTDLSPGADYLIQSLPKKKRQDISRAYKRGITVEMGGKEELEVIYNLMVDRYREQGRSVLVPKEYLFEIYDAYCDQIKIFVTKYEGEIATGLIDVLYNNSLYSWIGNPKPLTEISPSPNDLLLWEEIQYCCEHGFTSYVTMGAAGNERLHTYYSSKFNPDLDIRFSAKKCSSIIGCFESAYANAYKPAKSYIKKSGFP
ncbi:GNAT family N-acetyltransferase [Methanogenium sp. S4BF]|uniref:GNAT family N-acetyltransferase n=1 Tax=Methanogenium sp. S4BF TaxID=1789226 RepID=UPI002417F3C0|nr:GNAT family N-acetyltransferase [Methanogenium sp. S4BF]WFN35122.1 GNAT family N-acetyltransferase [Methanogenium sp. S4BF]